MSTTTQDQKRTQKGCLVFIIIFVGAGLIYKWTGHSISSSDERSSTPSTTNDEYTGNATCCSCNGSGKAKNAMDMCVVCAGRGSISKNSTYYRANCR